MKRTVKEIQHYEINPYTMAIIAEFGDGNYNVSRVIETENEFLVRKRPIDIIEDGCKYFGSSLKGRQDGTKEIASITHKPPIAIEPSSGIYMFPTNSPQKGDCSWLSHTYVINPIPLGLDQTIVMFTNEQSIILNVSHGSIENQIFRTAQFRFLLTSRIKPKLKVKNYSKEE